MAFILDPNLEQFSTPRQWEVLTALTQYDSERIAAEAIGCNRRVFHTAKRAVALKAAMAGYAPEYDLTHQSPPGYSLKGTSTLYGPDGEMKAQWVKTDRDREAQEQAMREAVAALSEDIPRAKPIKAPKATIDDLCNLMVLTDYHLGMLAWHRETGENWNIDIAEELLVKCFAHMLAVAPDAKTGIVCQLGDFLHFDGILSVTPTSNHVLDADSRFAKIVAVAIRALRQVIDMALAKHEHVHVIMAEGNHDMASSIWLRQMFAALYEKDPRVTVETTPLPYYAYQHGETALFFHHGHLKKFAGLTSLFAAQFPKVWGNTVKRYGHCGHLHHTHVKEDDGIILTQHQTLAAKDAYSARGGWFAERKTSCITYHKEHGQVAVNHVTPEMIE
jgi:hypothetical protein